MNRSSPTAYVLAAVLVSLVTPLAASAGRLIADKPSSPRAVAKAGDRQPAPRGRQDRRFDAIIVATARRHGVRPQLVRAMIAVESNFNPRAVSPKGAQGLMQLMPDTAAAFRVSNAFDPNENIRGGVAYLSRLLKHYDNDETLALAAYNAGPSAVARYGNRVPPYEETTRYIRKIRAISASVGGLADPPPMQAIYRVDTGTGRRSYTNVRPPDSVPHSIVVTWR